MVEDLVHVPGLRHHARNGIDTGDDYGEAGSDLPGHPGIQGGLESVHNFLRAAGNRRLGGTLSNLFS